jgi:hypothetical protein
MSETLNKIDVARKQIDSAIYLSFFDHDPVPIHTLTRAALEILEKLCEKRGIDYSLKELNKIIRSMGKPVYDKWVEHKNFFKHADKDYDANIKSFDERWNDLLLYTAIDLYQKLAKKSKRMESFQLWVLLIYYEMLIKYNPQMLGIISDQFIQYCLKMTREDSLLYGRLLYYYFHEQNKEKEADIVEKSLIAKYGKIPSYK